MTKYHNDRKADALTALPIAAVLLLAAFAIPTLGLIGVAEAKESKDDDHGKREFSRLFGNNGSQNEQDGPKLDARGDSPIRDLDIKSYGFKNNDAFIKVYGKAGGTLPAHHMDAIAYVLNIVTKTGENQIWAIDSHDAQHGTSGDPSTMWHAHRVHLTDNPATEEVDATCLNEVEHVTHAMMVGNKAIFENMKGKDSTVNAKEITSAATVRLEVQVEDPDNPPPGTACIALVAEVYDVAELSESQN